MAPLGEASSSPILPKINHRRAKSSQWAGARPMTKANYSPLAVKEGDAILFGKYSGTEIKIDGEDFLIMKEEEVLGVIPVLLRNRRREPRSSWFT
jgi:co-chaperonin GroES (HSP10)